jgi:hypothetical protein
MKGVRRNKLATSDAEKPLVPEKQRTVRRNATLENLGFPAVNIPLELHARIAAILLDGDNFEDASERALLLLNICSRRLEQENHALAMVNRMDTEFSRLGLTQDPVPFKHALKVITRQKRFDRAEADFLTFLELLRPEWSKAKRSAVFDGCRRTGFKRERVLDFVSHFFEMRAAGKLDKRRWNRKKKFLGKKNVRK